MERNCCFEGGYGLESQLNRRNKAINYKQYRFWYFRRPKYHQVGPEWPYAWRFRGEYGA